MIGKRSFSLPLRRLLIALIAKTAHEFTATNPSSTLEFESSELKLCISIVFCSKVVLQTLSSRFVVVRPLYKAVYHKRVIQAQWEVCTYYR